MARKNTIKIDDAVFQSKMRKLAKRYKVDEYDFIKEQGALYARDMAKAAPPFADGVINFKKQSIGSSKDKKQGEFAMWNDLQKIFVVQEDPQVIQWAVATFGRGPIYKGKKKTGKGVALTMSEIKRWHHRNMMPSSGRARALKYDQRLWVSEKILLQYFKKEKTKVGTAKAALAEAMVRINPKQRVPAWIKRNMSRADGKGRVLRSSKGPRAIIRASAYGLRSISSKIGFLQRFRVKAMEKRMINLVRANAKKSGLKVKLS